MPVTVSFRQIRTGGALTIPIVYFLTVTRLSGRTIFLQASKMDSRPRTGPRGSAIWHSCVRADPGDLRVHHHYVRV